MPPRGEDPALRSVTDSQPVRILKVVASVAVAFLVISLVALVWAPKDPGTLTLYGLVIGLNLMILLAFWPAVTWLQRLSR